MTTVVPPAPHLFQDQTTGEPIPGPTPVIAGDLDPRPGPTRPWRPKRVLVTKSAMAWDHGRRVAERAGGLGLDIVELPAPSTLRDEDGFVDWNYANHLVVNGGVIACGYGEPDADARAAAILGEAYGREVVTIDARPILQRGGGIHCITQQQPKSSA